MQSPSMNTRYSPEALRTASFRIIGFRKPRSSCHTCRTGNALSRDSFISRTASRVSGPLPSSATRTSDGGIDCPARLMRHILNASGRLYVGTITEIFMMFLDSVAGNPPVGHCMLSSAV